MFNMHIQRYISSGVIERYALELASKEEMTQLESLALEYAEIGLELNAVRSTLDAFAFKHAKTPAPYVKTKVFAAIRQGNNSRQDKDIHSSKVIELSGSSFKTTSSFAPFYKYVAAAVFFLLLGSAALNYLLYSKWTHKKNELAQTASDKQSQLVEVDLQKANFAKLSRDLTILRNPAMVSIELMGQTASPDAKALVYCNTKTNEVFLDVKKLPLPPDSMQYQFWAIVKGKPINGGLVLLCAASDTCGMLQMYSIADAHAFAISLEKKGGNTSPQGLIYAASGI
jgi:hypothetical protein